MIDNIPTVVIDTMKDNCLDYNCICSDASVFWNGYITVAAWLPLSTNWEEVWKQITTHPRSGRKWYLKIQRECSEKGYYCEQIIPQKYIQEIYDITHSKSLRQGHPMEKWWYNSSIEEMKEIIGPDRSFDCPHHYSKWFGVFTKEKKLVGYIMIRRCGELCYFNGILGHGDYLDDGIIFFLHFYIQNLMRESNDECYKGILGTAYHGYENGTKGLQFWKHKAGFAPYHIKLYDSSESQSIKKPEKEEGKAVPRP